MNRDEFYPLEFGDKNKEKIQKEAYIEWEKNNKKGIIVLPTATGKTQIALMALIKHRHLKDLFVIVPKVDLMNQWYDDIVNYCKVDKENVGRIGGGFKEDNRPITIAVIDSIRNKIFRSELLCVDEVHNIFSSKNSKFLLKGFHKRVMGLTATIEKSDNSHLKFLKDYPIVYRKELKDAVDLGVVSKFKIVNIGCDLTSEERLIYDKHTQTIKIFLPMFDYKIGDALIAMKCASDDTKQNAMRLMRAIQARKSLLSHTENKMIKSIELLLSMKTKVIVFSELVKTADYIIKELKKKGIKGAKFHSKMKKEEKQELFEQFKNNELRFMISVKSLKEGTNIPDCEDAIIISGNSTPRDILQQTGRVIRLSPDKDYATIYQIYCRNTKDEEWTTQRTNHNKRAALGVEWK